MSTNDNTNDFLSTATLDGGVTRVTLSRPSQGDSTDHAAAMAKAGERVTIKQGGAASHLSVTVGGDIEHAAGERITGAMSKHGMPRSGSSITEDSLIHIEGMPVTIKDALGLGLVQRDADGFRMAGGAASGKR
ncbi:MAG: hypothetical protein M9907_11975 [Burkholderiaceae bacterium]|nr:hypothetical protein [Burkholderiaceae bacterium]